MSHPSSSPRYASVQQRSKQRDATRFESLATAIVPLVIVFSALVGGFLYLSAKYATWEKDMHERLSTSGLADGAYTPSPIAKPGLFVTDHQTEIKAVLIGLLVVGAIVVASKIAKRIRP